MKYYLSPEAKGDLDEIWFYIAQDNLDAANRFIRHTYDELEMLAKNPYIATPREDLYSGLKMWAFKKRLIFFKVQDNSMNIFRIMHGTRDIKKILKIT